MSEGIRKTGDVWRPYGGGPPAARGPVGADAGVAARA
jgi:hypothetical protein